MKKEIQILVVEDDPDINGLILRILKKQGYQVTQAFSGTEAGLWLGQKEYDLMILDLMLPGLDGKEVLGKVRMERRLELPVLVLSAKAGLEDKVGLLTAGADDYMTKPSCAGAWEEQENRKERPLGNGKERKGEAKAEQRQILPWSFPTKRSGCCRKPERFW